MSFIERDICGGLFRHFGKVLRRIGMVVHACPVTPDTFRSPTMRPSSDEFHHATAFRTGM